MRMVMLQRRLDFRRMRLITGISSLSSALVIVLGAMAGYGAKALVLGGNVVVSLPFVVDLMLVERWRPQGAWFAWPNLRRYRQSLVFGAARVGSGLLAASRGALNAALLPATLGFQAIGLINRAEGLFATSAGRVLGVLSETVYPVLPQVAGDEPRFARVARGYSLALVTAAFAGVALFATCGKDLSRILYGSKWAAADPLLLPGAIVGLASSLVTLAGQLLLAKGRLKDVLALDAVSRLVMLPAFIGVVALDLSMVAFSWALAVPSALAALAALQWAGTRLPRGALAGLLSGPAIAASFAATTTLLVAWATGLQSLFLRTGVGVAVFVLSLYVVLRFVFPSLFAELLQLAPRRTKEDAARPHLGREETDARKEE